MRAPKPSGLDEPGAAQDRRAGPRSPAIAKAIDCPLTRRVFDQRDLSSNLFQPKEVIDADASLTMSGLYPIMSPWEKIPICLCVFQNPVAH